MVYLFWYFFFVFGCFNCFEFVVFFCVFFVSLCFCFLGVFCLFSVFCLVWTWFLVLSTLLLGPRLIFLEMLLYLGLRRPTPTSPVQRLWRLGTSFRLTASSAAVKATASATRRTPRPLLTPTTPLLPFWTELLVWPCWRLQLCSGWEL